MLRVGGEREKAEVEGGEEIEGRWDGCCTKGAESNREQQGQ